MNPVIDSIYANQGFRAPDGTLISPFPSAIKRNEGEALYHLVRTVKPDNTLEVGTAFGLSTLFFCQALRDNRRGCHTAIDPYQSHFKYLGLHNVKQAALDDLLTFREEPSQIALAQLVAEKKSFEVIFIDGAHVFDAVLVDFFFADQLIPVGGILVFDDLWMPAVRKVLHFILTNRSYEVAEEFMGDRPPFLRRHLQNLKYQARKRIKGKRNLGAPSEMRFHRGHNVNWCTLRKTAPDTRAWDHYERF